jgi:hypothetical protein
MTQLIYSPDAQANITSTLQITYLGPHGPVDHQLAIPAIRDRPDLSSDVPDDHTDRKREGRLS